MRRHIILLTVIVLMSAWSMETLAQTSPSKSDSITVALRLKNLREDKERIQNEIKKEDGKRNAQISGVSAETLEEINDKQDSICLSLRSQLVDTDLEIKELVPTVTSPQLINQYNNLVNRKEDSTSSQDNTGNPQKPATPTEDRTVGDDLIQ